MIKESLANDLLRLFFAQKDTSSISILSETCYIGLSTEIPNSDGSNFVEPATEDGYQRYLLGVRTAPVSWKMTEPSAGSIYNKETIFFPKCINNAWGEIKYFGLFANVSGTTTPVFWGELTTPTTVSVNDVAIFSPEQLKVTLA